MQSINIDSGLLIFKNGCQELKSPSPAVFRSVPEPHSLLLPIWVPRLKHPVSLNLNTMSVTGMALAPRPPRDFFELHLI
jgi:hypothetical protein